MADSVIQSSFNVGELSPALYARTDLQKYHSAAALLRNFFVDYRGGATTRPGTQYIAQCYKSTRVRLIPFQASFDVDYILEFGDHYIRFINNKAPVLEAAITLGAANTYVVGDWVYLTGSGSALDNNYYVVSSVGARPGLTTLAGAAVVTPANGNTARVYTIPSPYAASELAQLKFTQDVTSMVLCHPSYTPYALMLVTAANWTMMPITFGTAAQPPTNLQISSSNLGTGMVCYSYTVTSVDSNGQESGAAIPVQLLNKKDIRVQNGSIRLTWSPVAGAKSYNIYKSDVTYYNAVAPGVPYGYIGQAVGATFDDSNISPEFSETPPILQTPFLGGGIQNVTVTAPGTYRTVPTVTASAPDVAGSPYPQLAASLSVTSFGPPPGGYGGAAYNVGNLVDFGNGLVLRVSSVDGNGMVLAFNPVPVSAGTISTGKVPNNPINDSGPDVNYCSINAVWGVGSVAIFAPGSGYLNAPTLTFSPAGATATASINTAIKPGFPTVPAFYQQRLFLGGSIAAPSTFYLSQPGNHYNFNTSKPVQADDSITATLVSGQLNTIKSAVATSAGLIIFTDKATWLVNGGSAGSAVAPSAIVANPQGSGGASDLPPIVVNSDILYGQAKGSTVRDTIYSVYTNTYAGNDTSVLSSHLFYGHELLEWAFAEEPYKVVWAVRDDGILLSLTFLKEQEFAGWAHSDTAGLFESVATVVESTATAGEVDAIYVVVNRTINGVPVRYIERLAERQFASAVNAWCVDCGVRYSGAPKSTFSGAQQLAGQVVTGVADGKVIPPFTMPATGTFTLPTPASTVLVGLGFTAQLQTLALDTGEPTMQGKMKRITTVTLRLAQTLGLKIGSSFATLVSMKDTTVGNVGKMSNTVVADLVSCDADTIIDPTYTVPGQYCIQQDLPLPATILGVIPKFYTGDSK